MAVVDANRFAILQVGGFSDDGARMYMGNCGGRVCVWHVWQVWQVWHVWQLKSSAQIYVVSGQV